MSTFGECVKFFVGDIGVDGTESCEGAESTIGAGIDSFFSDDIDKFFESLSDEFGVFDEVCGGVDDAWYEYFVIGYEVFILLEDFPFVSVSGV